MSAFNESKTGESIQKLRSLVGEAKAMQAAISERLKPVLVDHAKQAQELSAAIGMGVQAPVPLVAEIELIENEVIDICRENRRILEFLAL